MKELDLHNIQKNHIVEIIRFFTAPNVLKDTSIPSLEMLLQRIKNHANSSIGELQWIYEKRIDPNILDIRFTMREYPMTVYSVSVNLSNEDITNTITEGWKLVEM